MIRVLLMLPIRKGDFFYVPDLGLGYLATALRAKLPGKVSVELMVKNLNLSDETFKRFLVEGSFNVIGIKVFATSVGSTRRTIELIREASPGSAVIVGGPQATGDPNYILDYLPADFALEGEGEVGFPMLVGELSKGQLKKETAGGIPGLIWRGDNGIHRNPKVLVEDLDALGAPAWDLMDPRDFPSQYGRFAQHFPVASILTTRGCPFSCTFCSVGRTRLRRRSPDVIINEIEVLHHTYGIREFNLLDSNCAHNKEYLIDFCKALIRSGLNLPWRIPGGLRLTSLDEEVLYWMKKSGCYQVWVGIESGSNEILREIKKSLTVEEIRQKVGLINQFHIDVGGFFILGFPGEGRREVTKTLKFAKELKLNYAVFTIFTPEPGSELYDRLNRAGLLGDLDFDSLDGRKYRNAFTEYSPEALSRLRDWATLSFHLRPRVLKGILRDFSSPRKILLLARIGSHFVWHRKSW